MNFKKLQLVLLFLCCTGLFAFVSGQETIRILAIGNSFSQDAAESYVDDLAKADGVKLIIANMYIGGCSLETHWKNAEADLPAYSYRKITDGDTIVTEHQKLITAIRDEKWDYITFQQVSSLSGIPESYFPCLTNLTAYVRKNGTNPKVKFAFHQTWAYQGNSSHQGFANYGNDQQKMYEAIVNTVFRNAKKAGISIVIPSGTAIQNGRTSFVGDHFCRDGYHLSLTVGRYTAACTWYEKLLKRPVTGNKFIPAGMTAEEARMAQLAAHQAIKQPKTVSFTNTPSIIAHRGASAYDTENSPGAFRKAFELGADAIELDLWKTADDSLVVIHDRTTGRVADRDLAVPETTAAELRTLRLRNGEKIPYLSEVLPLLPPGKKIVIEIKCYNEKGSTGKVFPQLKTLLQQSGRMNDAIIISFGAEALAEAKQCLPANKCYFLSGKENSGDELVALCKQYGFDGLNVHYKILTESLREKTRAAGLDLLTWTVDDPKIIKSVSGKVRSITTNKPDIALKIAR